MTFRLNIDFEEKIMKNGLNFKRYEDNLIKASYDFYQKLINERLKVIYDESLNKYNNTLGYLYKEIEQNYDLFTNSISEFRIMASIYSSIFQQNSTKDFYLVIRYSGTALNSSAVTQSAGKFTFTFGQN